MSDTIVLKKEKNSYLFSNHDLKEMFLPLIIEQFLNFFVGLVDSIMVAQVGEYAVSGVSLIDNVMVLLISFFSAMATGGAVIAGQYLGRRDHEQAKHAANQLMKVMLILSILLMLVLYACRLFILDVLYGNITGDVRRAAYIYLVVVGASIPFLGLYHGGAAIFRTMNKPKVTMYVMTAMNIVNIFGNALLVLRYHLGVLGIAIPTLVSRIGAAVIILILADQKKNSLCVQGWLFERFDITMVRRVFRIGLPFGFESGLFNLGRLLVLNIVTHYSTAAIAANAAGGTISMMILIPGSAINLGLSVVVSRCVGADDYDQTRYYVRKIAKILQCGLLISAGIVLVAMPLLMKIYHLSGEATRLTWIIVILYAIFINLLYTPSWAFPVVFRGAGDANFPMAVNIISMLLCRIVLAYVFAYGFNLGMMGTWYAMYCDWGLRAVIYLFRYRSGKWTTYHALR